MRIKSSTAPITVELSGGIGNQLFQLAAAVVVSNRTNREFRLDPLNVVFSGFHGVQRRQLLISELLSKSELLGVSSAMFLRLSSSTSKRLCEAGPLDDVIQRVDGSTRRIFGYFQRFELAESASTEIFSRLESSRVSRQILQPEPKQYIAVHVRRGDYLRPKAQSYHGLIGKDYFLNAIRFASSRTGIGTVKIVSDDSIAAEDLISKPLMTEGFTVLPQSPDTEWGDLGVLANSAAIVMSNSSFSWWGAYIAHKQHKTLVIAPEPWLVVNSSGIETVLFAKEWHVLNRYSGSKSDNA